MYQVRIEPETKTRFRICLNGQAAFVLYRSEISRYGLRDGAEADEELIERIRNEAVLKRAKQKVLKLLQDMDRTKSELQERLIQAGFPEDIAEQAIAYAESFGYVNDRRCIENFVLSRKGTKSRKEIYAALRRKQTDREVIDEVMETCCKEEDSLEAIRRLLKKKRYCSKTAGPEEKKKVYGYLARKGFGYGEIRTAMELTDWEEEC